MLLSTDEKNGIGITTGNTENASHPPAFFSENNLEQNSKKREEGEKHSTKSRQGIENILLTPPHQNASHPEKNLDSLPLKKEKVKESLNNCQDEESQTNCEPVAVKSEFPQSAVIEKLSKFGITKAYFKAKVSPRKNTKCECDINFEFPDGSKLRVKRHANLSNRESLDKYVNERVTVWEYNFMLNPENKWDVEVMGGTDEDPEMVWVKDCIMKIPAAPPITCWYTFVSPTGEELRVSGEDAFKLSKK